jgi:hypothetical protein
MLGPLALAGLCSTGEAKASRAPRAHSERNTAPSSRFTTEAGFSS